MLQQHPIQTPATGPDWAGPAVGSTPSAGRVRRRSGLNDPTLRRLRLGDAPEVLAAFASGKDLARQGDVTDLASAIVYIERLTEAAGPHLAFAIAHDERLAGLVGLTVDLDNRSGWFWYWMHPECRRRGWTSRAAATVADWALTEVGLERLELGHRVDNLASAGVANAAGFRREGLARSKLLIDGERLDLVGYSRLPSDPLPAVPRLRLTDR